MYIISLVVSPPGSYVWCDVDRPCTLPPSTNAGWKPYFPLSELLPALTEARVPSLRSVASLNIAT